MVENVIYYSICFFFALIGLGAFWDSRFSHTRKYLTVFLGIPAVLLTLAIIGVDLRLVLDVRELLPWSFDSSTQLGARGRGAVVTVITFAVVAFITSALLLSIQCLARLTRQG